MTWPRAGRGCITCRGTWWRAVSRRRPRSPTWCASSCTTTPAGCSCRGPSGRPWWWSAAATRAAPANRCWGRSRSTASDTAPVPVVIVPAPARLERRAAAGAQAGLEPGRTGYRAPRRGLWSGGGADHRGVAEYQMRALLDANRAIVADLDLALVLRRIVESAVDLVGATVRRAGQSVGADGALEEFVHVGMDDESIAAIGHLPEGKGLLGLVIEEQQAIRVDDLTAHAGSVGLPAGHPPMRAFLGVPVRVRDEAYGNLYLTRSEVEPFSRAGRGPRPGAGRNGRGRHRERAAVRGGAAPAGVARGLHRRHPSGARRRRGALRLIARRVHALADADADHRRPPGRHRAAGGGRRGPRRGRHRGRAVRRVRHPQRARHPERQAGASGGRRATPTTLEGRTIYLSGEVQVGPVMVLPLLGREEVRGTLVVMRGPQRRPFTEADAEMATTFANHASVALELAEARRDQQRVLLLEDRARIARDLHDHVIQQVFAAGLVLQATASGLRDRAVVDRAAGGRGQPRRRDQADPGLDLPAPAAGAAAGCASAVMDVVAEVQPGLARRPAGRPRRAARLGGDRRPGRRRHRRGPRGAWSTSPATRPPRRCS